MAQLDVRTINSDTYLPSIISLAQEIENVEHHRALADHRWIDLTNHSSQSLDTLMALDVDTQVVAGIITRNATNKGIEIELAVRPSYPYELVVKELLGAALADGSAPSAQRVSLWIPNPNDERDRLYRSLGFTADREVIQMRRTLPVEGLIRATDVTIRPFQPGVDESGWLTVNNRAFDWHPDQGDWDLATLEEREHEPWFDPEGFFIIDNGTRIQGFCWTKIHYDSHPMIGEIYVIAVDPEDTGKGLGKALLVEGMYYLGEVRKLSSIMLYVERNNAGAQALYRRFGFTVDHSDRRYVLPPAAKSADQR
ncbi:mycothiol synthase [Ferrimicrobium acidiphilum]|uniref:mycothiol synthase n=1 Tax=Ferrimicrobium acidiphilum TaxID=121039 RepID=UPI0023F38AB9|nr:mycothiol synthase [Ferrimicrobium acidiphilum]